MVKQDQAMDQGSVPERLQVIALKQGKESAFEFLYQLYAKQVYAFALTFFRNRLEAEGTVQEVFTKIWINREHINEDLSFKNYLFTISKNYILNKIRERKIQLKYLESKSGIPAGTNYTEEDVFFADFKELIDEAIRALPERRRMAFELSRNHGLSYKEIAQKMGTSVKTVEVQISKAIKQIKEMIGYDKIKE